MFHPYFTAVRLISLTLIFLFSGITLPAALCFGKSKKNKNKNYKSQKMLAGHNKNCSIYWPHKAVII